MSFFNESDDIVSALSRKREKERAIREREQAPAVPTPVKDTGGRSKLGRLIFGEARAVPAPGPTARAVPAPGPTARAVPAPGPTAREVAKLAQGGGRTQSPYAWYAPQLDMETYKEQWGPMAATGDEAQAAIDRINAGQKSVVRTVREAKAGARLLGGATREYFTDPGNATLRFYRGLGGGVKNLGYNIAGFADRFINDGENRELLRAKRFQPQTPVEILSTGLGTSIPQLMVGGVAFKAAKAYPSMKLPAISAGILPAVAGTGGEVALDEAKQRTPSKLEVLGGGALGLTEFFPIKRMVWKGVGGRLKNIGVAAGTEAFQELGVNVGINAMAGREGGYDPGRSLGEGGGEAFATGLFAGGITRGLFDASDAVMARIKNRREVEISKRIPPRMDKEGELADTLPLPSELIDNLDVAEAMPPTGLPEFLDSPTSQPDMPAALETPAKPPAAKDLPELSITKISKEAEGLKRDDRARDEVKVKAERAARFQAEYQSKDVLKSGRVPDEGADDTVIHPKTHEDAPVTYAVVPLAELNTSYNESNYMELQGRDKNSPGYSTRIIGMINDFRPKFLGKSSVVQEGAPVVTRNGHAISNGRLELLRRIYSEPKNAEKRDAYTNFLRKEGIGEEVTEGMKHPVLVRVLNQEMTLDEAKDYATEGNTSNLASQTSAEKAVEDSRRILATPNAEALFTDDKDGWGNFANALPAGDQTTAYVKDKAGKAAISGAVRERYRIAKAAIVFGEHMGQEARVLLAKIDDADGGNLPSKMFAIAEGLFPLILDRNDGRVHSDLDFSNELLELYRGIQRLSTSAQKLPAATSIVESLDGQTDLFAATKDQTTNLPLSIAYAMLFKPKLVGKGGGVQKSTIGEGHDSIIKDVKPKWEWRTADNARAQARLYTKIVRSSTNAGGEADPQSSFVAGERATAASVLREVAGFNAPAQKIGMMSASQRGIPSDAPQTPAVAPKTPLRKTPPPVSLPGAEKRYIGPPRPTAEVINDAPKAVREQVNKLMEKPDKEILAEIDRIDASEKAREATLADEKAGTGKKKKLIIDAKNVKADQERRVVLSNILRLKELDAEAHQKPAVKMEVQIDDIMNFSSANRVFSPFDDADALESAQELEAEGWTLSGTDITTMDSDFGELKFIRTKNNTIQVKRKHEGKKILELVAEYTPPRTIEEQREVDEAEYVPTLDDGGDVGIGKTKKPRHSTPTTEGVGLTIDQINAEIKESPDHAIIKEMLAKGKVEIISVEEASRYGGRKGRKAAGIQAGGKFYLVQENMRPGGVAGVFWHESNHVVMDTVLDTATTAKVLTDVRKMREVGVREFKRGEERARKAGTKEKDIDMETAAYVLQMAQDAQGRGGEELSTQARRWVKRIIGIIKAALYRLGARKTLDADVLYGMTRAGLQRAIKKSEKLAPATFKFSSGARFSTPAKGHPGQKLTKALIINPDLVPNAYKHFRMGLYPTTGNLGGLGGNMDKHGAVRIHPLMDKAMKRHLDEGASKDVHNREMEELRKFDFIALRIWNRWMTPKQRKAFSGILAGRGHEATNFVIGMREYILQSAEVAKDRDPAFYAALQKMFDKNKHVDTGVRALKGGVDQIIDGVGDEIGMTALEKKRGNEAMADAVLDAPWRRALLRAGGPKELFSDKMVQLRGMVDDHSARAGYLSHKFLGGKESPYSYVPTFLHSQLIGLANSTTRITPVLTSRGSMVVNRVMAYTPENMAQAPKKGIFSLSKVAGTISKAKADLKDPGWMGRRQETGYAMEYRDDGVAFKEILDTIGEKADDFFSYLQAKRSVELGKRNRLFTKPEIENMLARGDLIENLQETEELWREMSSQMLDLMVDGQLFSQETADSLRDDTWIAFARSGRGQVKSQKKLVGGTGNVKDAISGTIEAIAEVHNATALNIAMLQLVETIGEHKDGGMIMSKVKDHPVAVQVSRDDVIKGLARGAEGVTAAEALDMFSGSTAQEVMDIWLYPKGESALKESEFIVMRKGKPEVWQINDEQLVRGLAALHTERTNKFQGYMESIQSLWQASITRFPTMAFIRFPIKDFMSIGVQTGMWFSPFHGSTMKKGERWMGGSASTNKTVEEFHGYGGSFGRLFGKRNREPEKQLKKSLDDIHPDELSRWNKTIRGLNEAFLRSERAFRIAAFDRYRKMGFAGPVAATMADHRVGPFSKYGHSAVANFIYAIPALPFLHATAVSVVSLVDAVRTEHGRGRIARGLAALIAVDLARNLWNEMFGFDEWEEEAQGWSTNFRFVVPTLSAIEFYKEHGRFPGAGWESAAARHAEREGHYIFADIPRGHTLGATAQMIQLQGRTITGGIPRRQYIERMYELFQRMVYDFTGGAAEYGINILTGKTASGINVHRRDQGERADNVAFGDSATTNKLSQGLTHFGLDVSPRYAKRFITGLTTLYGKATLDFADYLTLHLQGYSQKIKLADGGIMQLMSKLPMMKSHAVPVGVRESFENIFESNMSAATLNYSAEMGLGGGKDDIAKKIDGMLDGGQLAAQITTMSGVHNWMMDWVRTMPLKKDEYFQLLDPNTTPDEQKKKFLYDIARDFYKMSTLRERSPRGNDTPGMREMRQISLPQKFLRRLNTAQKEGNLGELKRMAEASIKRSMLVFVMIMEEARSAAVKQAKRQKK